MKGALTKYEHVEIKDFDCGSVIKKTKQNK